MFCMLKRCAAFTTGGHRLHRLEPRAFQALPLCAKQLFCTCLIYTCVAPCIRARQDTRPLHLSFSMHQGNADRQHKSLAPLGGLLNVGWLKTWSPCNENPGVQAHLSLSLYQGTENRRRMTVPALSRSARVSNRGATRWASQPCCTYTTSMKVSNQPHSGTSYTITAGPGDWHMLVGISCRWTTQAVLPASPVR